MGGGIGEMGVIKWSLKGNIMDPQGITKSPASLSNMGCGSFVKPFCHKDGQAEGLEVLVVSS